MKPKGTRNKDKVVQMDRKQLQHDKQRQMDPLELLEFEEIKNIIDNDPIGKLMLNGDYTYTASGKINYAKCCKLLGIQPKVGTRYKGQLKSIIDNKIKELKKKLENAGYD
jgi:hypothetical protein